MRDRSRRKAYADQIISLVFIIGFTQIGGTSARSGGGVEGRGRESDDYNLSQDLRDRLRSLRAMKPDSGDVCQRAGYEMADPYKTTFLFWRN